MDPIATAILAVLPTLVTGTLSSLVKDAYGALKEVIKRKYGDKGHPTTALNALEQDPASPQKAEALNATLQEANASNEAEIVAALKSLVAQLKANDIGGRAVTEIHFTQQGGVIQGIGAAQDVRVGTMTFGPPTNR